MEYTDRRQYIQLFLAMIGILLVLFLVYNLYYEFRPPQIYLDENVGKKISAQMSAGESNSNNPPSTPFFDQKRCQDAVIQYMTKPAFINSDFTSQVTDTDSRLEVFQVNENKLYFSHPASGFSQDKIFSALTNNPSKVELGTLNDDRRIQLGRYKFKRPQSVVFCFPASDLKFDKNKQIRVAYADTQYSITIEELFHCYSNFNQYEGYTRILKDYRFGKKTIFVNHCPWIVTSGEPSLKRFVLSLTDQNQKTEEKAQILLDLVTSQIKYNYREAYANYETMKRANEVLLSKSSDCSGKTILYASLLEQIGAEYLLLYLKNHIALAVEGKFRKRNGLYFKFDGKEYYLAETTYLGFKIGLTSLDRVFKIQYLQKPGDFQKIYDVSDGSALRSELS
jgi:hypothetical protein